MLSKQLLLAATAAAYLVIPETSAADEEIVSILPIAVDTADEGGVPSVLTSHSLALPCQECRGDDAHLQMDLAVEDGYRLTLNGFELYPSADPFHGDLTAAVTPADGEEQEQEQTLGYSLFVKPEAVDEEQQLSVVGIELNVIEVGGEFLKGIPTVDVKLIKAPSGEIVIGSVDMVQVAKEEYSPEKEAAKSPMLRIKEKFEAFLKKLKGGCGRHSGGQGKRPFRHDNPHSHRKGGGRRHDWGKLVKNIAANIILPVLAGITAGVGVAVLAMGLCSCLALVFHVRRRKCRRAARHAKVAASEPAAFAEEKAGLMEAEEQHDDAPPQYVDEEQAK